jgi:hypothetical protein
MDERVAMAIAHWCRRETRRQDPAAGRGPRVSGRAAA